MNDCHGLTDLDLTNLTVLRLLSRVRLLSVAQVGAVVAPHAKDGTRAAEAFCERMEKAGLVDRYRMVARTPAPADTFLDYRVGQPAPDFRALSRELRARTASTTLTVVDVVRLGPTGAALLGTYVPRAARRSEGSHELQLAATALELHLKGQVRTWLSEDDIVRGRLWHGVMPDAEVHLASGESFALECGGAYSTAKLANFHARAVAQLDVRGLDGYRIV